MQVQSIQTTNNCRKPCFKAQFVNDPQGYFRTMWSKATKNNALKDEIKKFASKNTHNIEIIGVKDGWNDVGSGLDKSRVFGSFYKLFNHYNGKFSEYFVSSSDNARLFNLLNLINKDHNIFNDDYASDSYRYLTGQAKLQTEK